nr:zinc finger, CCHC-type [Tanacetum cinerariifolium]
TFSLLVYGLSATPTSKWELLDCADHREYSREGLDSLDDGDKERRGVAFHAINARRLPLAPPVYTLMTTSSANNPVFRGFFEKQKLSGPNFIDWYRQLRIVLSIEDKLNYLEQLIPPALVVPAGQHVALEILAAHTAWIKGSKEIAGLMLMTMSQRSNEIWKPFILKRCYWS